MSSHAKIYEVAARLQRNVLELQQQIQRAHLDAARERSRGADHLRMKAQRALERHSETGTLYAGAAGIEVVNELDEAAEELDRGEHHETARQAAKNQLALPWKAA